MVRRMRGPWICRRMAQEYDRQQRRSCGEDRGHRLRHTAKGRTPSSATGVLNGDEDNPGETEPGEEVTRDQKRRPRKGRLPDQSTQRAYCPHGREDLQSAQRSRRHACLKGHCWGPPCSERMYAMAARRSCGGTCTAYDGMFFCPRLRISDI